MVRPHRARGGLLRAGFSPSVSVPDLDDAAFIQASMQRPALDTQAFALAWREDALEQAAIKFFSRGAQEARLDMLTRAWVDNLPVDAYALYEAQLATNVVHPPDAPKLETKPSSLLRTLQRMAGFFKKPARQKLADPQAYSLVSPIDMLASKLYSEGGWGTNVEIVVLPVQVIRILARTAKELTF
jgi:hypothetical protein